MNRISFSLAGIILALLVVGVVSNTLTRHLIQIAPMVIALVLAILRIHWSNWVALPLFMFWLAVMAFIWLFLLGIARVVSGHFTPTEIAMTIIIGILCMLGILGALRSQSRATNFAKIFLFLAFAGFQLLAIWMSYGSLPFHFH